MHHVHSAIRSHSCVHDIDEALCDGDFHALMEITNVDDFESLLSNDVESSYEQCTDTVVADSMLRQPHLESKTTLRTTPTTIPAEETRPPTYRPHHRSHD